jgi:hypothetical protein
MTHSFRAKTRPNFYECQHQEPFVVKASSLVDIRLNSRQMFKKSFLSQWKETSVCLHSWHYSGVRHLKAVVVKHDSPEDKSQEDSFFTRFCSCNFLIPEREERLWLHTQKRIPSLLSPLWSHLNLEFVSTQLCMSLVTGYLYAFGERETR